MKKRVTLAALLSFCTLLPALGQTTPVDDKDDVVRITTNLVQIDVVVTKNGKPVPNLKAEDFEIYEDGRRQPITSFAFVSNVGANAATVPVKSSEIKNGVFVPPAPVKRDVPRRTIAIVVDDLGLSAESMSSVRRSVRKFVAEQMQPNDLVAILRTGSQVGALQQFTNDKRLLNRAVDQLRWNLCSRVGINVLPAAGTQRYAGCPYSYGNTLGAMRSIVDAMGELPGRKSLILLSDSIPIQNQELEPYEYENLPEGAGNDWLYRRGLNKIAERAIRASVVIYSVDTQGLQTLGPTAADRFTGDVRQFGPQMQNLLANRSRLLQDRRAGGDMLARQTGGFQIRNSNDLGLDRIMTDQSGYYLLGYRPSDETFNKRFHHIKAKLRKSGLDVRTRLGFYGVSEDDVKLQLRSPRQMTNLALMSPFGAQNLEVELASFFANDAAAGSLVRSFIYLDPSELTFKPVNDRQETSLEIHGVLFGDNGVPVEQVTHGLALSLKEAEFEKAKREGLRLRFDMPARRPGAYQVRIAVREGFGYKIGSAGQFVAVPDLRNKQLALSGVVLQGVADPAAENAALSSPALRRYQANSDIYFAFAVYNGSPSMTMQTKLFCDGKSVKSSPETAVDTTNQRDPERLLVTNVLRLPADLEPGNYYLQVVVTDKAAGAKQPPATQWVDFEIVK
ncbi:MAG TPA: VWA domain-containing protein [Pyrinomonadaceae bacterium]|nr:VWA domain-containing protein [Pyrinomonadaceae bacterium]